MATLVPGFSVEVYELPPLIKLKCVGFWDEATLRTYTIEMAAILDRFSRQGISAGQVSILSDQREQNILSADSAEGFKNMLDQARPVSKVAILVGGALQKMQYHRLAETQRRKIFFDEEEAMLWLRSGKF